MDSVAVTAKSDSTSNRKGPAMQEERPLTLRQATPSCATPRAGCRAFWRSCAACATPPPAAPGTSPGFHDHRALPIEEAHEVADAIERQAWTSCRASWAICCCRRSITRRWRPRRGRFTFDSVVRAIADKMLARPPHVFGDESREKSPSSRPPDWERMKAAERGPARHARRRALGLPALTRAVKLQKRAARVGSTGHRPTRSSPRCWKRRANWPRPAPP